MIKELKPEKFAKIEELFNKLINPIFTYKIVNHDGSEWIYQKENDVTIPKANFQEIDE